MVCRFLGGEGTREAPVVLRLPADEILPYEEVSPNREIVQDRLAALFHLRQATPSVKALVLSSRALARRYARCHAVHTLAHAPGVSKG